MTMRDCPDGDVRDALPLYVTDRLNGADKARVEAHAHGCADCTAEINLLRAANRAFDGAPIDAAWVAAVVPKARTARMPMPFHPQSLWRVAAAITVMVAGTATLMVVRQPTLVPGIDSVGVPGVSPSALRSLPPGETTLALGGDARVLANATIDFGNNLSDLTDAQLEALLASLERLDGTVLADPATLVAAIVPEAPVRRNP